MLALQHTLNTKYRFCSPLPELHIFTDASISALSAVIYAGQPPSETAPARLVCVLAKTGAPIKQRRVPILELEAAVYSAPF